MPDSVRSPFYVGLGLAVLVMLWGCTSGREGQGRSALSPATAGQVKPAEELLLNLVRVHYREPLRFQRLVSIAVELPHLEDSSASGVVPSELLRQRLRSTNRPLRRPPSMTYKALAGENFIAQLRQDVPLATLDLLIRGGWGIERVMHLMVERLGGLYNYPETGFHARFEELIALWGKLQRRGDLQLLRRTGSEHQGAAAAAGSHGLLMTLRYANTHEADRADGLLGVAPARRDGPRGGIMERLQLTAFGELLPHAPKSTGATPVPIWPRSMFSQLFYLARSIEVPVPHQNQVRVYRDLRGRPVNPRPALQEWIDIRSSSMPPTNASVAVRYRDYWFYIDDRDQQSKRTFSLLSMLVTLQTSS